MIMSSTNSMGEIDSVCDSHHIKAIKMKQLRETEQKMKENQLRNKKD